MVIGITNIISFPIRCFPPHKDPHKKYKFYISNRIPRALLLVKKSLNISSELGIITATFPAPQPHVCEWYLRKKNLLHKHHEDKQPQNQFTVITNKYLHKLCPKIYSVKHGSSTHHTFIVIRKAMSSLGIHQAAALPLAVDIVSTCSLHLASHSEFLGWILHQAIKVLLLNHTWLILIIDKPPTQKNVSCLW